MKVREKERILNSKNRIFTGEDMKSIRKCRESLMKEVQVGVNRNIYLVDL